MNDSEKDLITANYEIEKASIKQKRMAEQLDHLNTQLRKNKRNTTIRYLTLFIFLLVIGGATFYFLKGEALTKKLSEFINMNPKESNTVTTDSIFEQPENEDDILINGQDIEKSDSLSQSNSITSSNNIESAIEGEESNTEVVDETMKEKVVTKLAYGYIKNVFLQEEETYLEIDFVDYYFGDEATEMAIQNGDATEKIGTEGDTTYSYNKNYYIHNPVEKKEIFKLNKSAEISMLKKGNFSFEKFRTALKKTALVAVEITETEVFSLEGLNVK